jgi:diadenosine tetraphosphate (Ap4A) HIT family hydrolase
MLTSPPVRVARALETHLEPVKTNYSVLGNSLPHLHTHVVRRYADDPKPSWPFPFSDDDQPPLEEQAFRRDVDALRALLA